MDNNLELFNPQRIPEEILEKIFAHLSSPQDLINVSRACPQFDRILEPTKTKWLFNAVLPILFEDLSKKDILNCRRVCQNWKEAVTNLLDNHHEVRPYDPELDKNLTPATRQYHSSLNSTGLGFDGFLLGNNHIRMERRITPRQWLRKMEGHQGNPFVVKFLKMDSVNYHYDNEYWTYALRFLKKYGKHILHFKILFQDNTHDFLEFYKKFRNCLKHLPNLQSIVLSRSYNLLPPNYDLNDPTSQQETKEFIRLHPLPQLPRLSTFYLVLETFNYNASQLEIVEELFRRYQRQFKKVTVDPDICVCDLENRPTLNLYFWAAEKITELTLIENRDTVTGSSITKFLRGLRPLPNLGKLTIKIMYFAEGHNIQDIMEALQRFPTLKVLKLVFFCRVEINGQESRLQPKVQLPNIKILDITFQASHSNNCYDGILCYLPDLEFLKIDHISYSHNENREEMEGDNLFQVMEALRSGKLYDSDIWRKIKFLREISCLRTSLGNQNPEGPLDLIRFTRERYEQLKMKPEEVPN